MDKHLQQAQALSAQAGEMVRAGRLDQAESLLTRAVKAAPREAALWCNLGSVQGMAGQLADSERSFRRASQLAPARPEIWTNLGRTQLQRGHLDAAEASAARGVALDPASAMAAKTLGDIHLVRGRADEAIAHLERALALRPDWVEAINSLGSAFKQTWRLDEAVAACRRSLALAPTDTAARNLVLALTYHPDCSDDELFAAQADWARRVTPPAPPPPFANSPVPGRRLRVGYVSADFRNHPVARNILGLLRHHDRDRVEVFAYAHLPAADDTSREVARAVDHWRVITALTDAQAAAAIRADGIDVLVSLAGWTGANRPGICAQRAAPVQVSFHDVGSSGLAAMDGWLTDAVLHPAGTSERFTERLMRLPCFYLHEPVTDRPETGPLPARADGPITFASFNNPVKINARVLDLWAACLAAVPDSRLLLRYQSVFDDEAMRHRFVQAMAQRGIGAERLAFGPGKLSRAEHLALYHQADIALDTYPFNGSTTTYEALIMGVPVVSLAGGRFVGRVGLSLLSAVGLSELTACDESGFVAIARALAEDRPRLARLRQGLRRRVEESPLLDAAAHARAVEAAYGELWRGWCAAAGA